MTSRKIQDKYQYWNILESRKGEMVAFSIIVSSRNGWDRYLPDISSSMSLSDGFDHDQMSILFTWIWQDHLSRLWRRIVAAMWISLEDFVKTFVYIDEMCERYCSLTRD